MTNKLFWVELSWIQSNKDKLYIEAQERCNDVERFVLNPLVLNLVTKIIHMKEAVLSDVQSTK